MDVDMKKTPITVAYGDGIGPEIMNATLAILDAAENKGKVIPLFVIDDKNFIEPALAVTPLEVGKENKFVYLQIS